LARKTASSTSTLVATGKTPTTSPVAGLIDSNVLGFFARADRGLVAIG
jgi:hypothetical protein